MKWDTRKLGELCSIRTGKLNSEAAVENGEYPFFTCAPETYRINRYSFDTEAVLLAGNNASGIYPLKYYKGKFDAYQRTYVLESLDEELLNVRYLYFALVPVLGYFQSISIGASTQYLTKGVLDNFRLPSPPIEKQSKIAAILSAYDNLIENNLKRIALLEEAARLLYKEWFIHLHFPGHEHTRIVGGVPEGWDKKKLGDVITLNYGKGLKQEDRIEGEYPVYGSSGVVGTHASFLVKAPGIIIGRKGNVGSVFWAHKDFYPIDTVYYIESSQCNFFLYHNLLSRTFMNNDGAVPGLNRSYAYSQPIVTPSKTLRARFEETVTPTHEQIFKLQAMNEKLKQARDLLLPRLMSGEIPV
jgi:type I restriction enzyme S subunit